MKTIRQKIVEILERDVEWSDSQKKAIREDNESRADQILKEFLEIVGEDDKLAKIKGIGDIGKATLNFAKGKNQAKQEIRDKIAKL